MNHQKHSIGAVCLDVDGTFYSIRRMIIRHLPTIFPIRNFFSQLHSIRDGMRGQRFDDFRAEQAIRLGKTLGIDPKQAASQVEEVIDRRWMGIFDRVKPFPGLLDTLGGLSNMGLKLAVLSDYPVWPKLGGLGLAKVPFAAVVNAEEVGALKPHSAAFREVLQILGMPADRVLHVGDIERNDVQGALAVGMKAARFYEGRRPDTRAAFAFRDWRRLVPLLRWKGLLA